MSNDCSKKRTGAYNNANVRSCSVVDCNVFRKFFRRALVEAGMNPADAKGMTFHAWRHFYTTYMADKVNQRALQSQTGHKSQIMLEHYASHQTAEEARLITAAQAEVFGSIFN